MHATQPTMSFLGAETDVEFVEGFVLVLDVDHVEEVPEDDAHGRDVLGHQSGQGGVVDGRQQGLPLRACLVLAATTTRQK